MADNSAARGVMTLRMPGSGWLLQWRSDGFWRELHDAQHHDELNGIHVPFEDEWARWTGFALPHVRGGSRRGVVTWWFSYGELPGSAAPSVVLADGTRPPVLLLGRVWACEWRAVAQPGTVLVEGKPFDLPLPFSALWWAPDR